MKFYTVLFLFFFMLPGIVAQNAKDKTREAKKDKAVHMYGYTLNTNKKSNIWAIAPLYEEASRYFSENIAAVQLNGKVGYIDIYNRFVITPRFDANDDLMAFSQGLSAVKKDGKYGFIDKTGALVIEPQYEWAENFNENLIAAVKKEGKVGAIDLLGEEILPFKYLTEEVMRFASLGKTYKNAINAVKANKDNGKYDAVLERIRQANSPIEANIRDEKYMPELPAGVEPFEEGGKWGLRQNGETCILQPAYDEIMEVTPLFSLIRKEDKWGVCDVYGRILLPCRYEFVDYDPKDELFQVKEDGFIGLYEDDGRLLVEPCLDHIESFKSGMTQVWSGSSMGVLSRDGKIGDGFSGVVLEEADEIAAQGDVVKARQLYEKVIRLDESCGMAYISLGVLEVDAQMTEEGIAHIKEGGKISKLYSSYASHNLKEAKKPMGQRNWMDGRWNYNLKKRMQAGEAQVDMAGIDPKFSKELSAQIQAQASSLSNSSSNQKNDKACCEALKVRYNELKGKVDTLKSDAFKQAMQRELERLERLILTKGGVI